MFFFFVFMQMTAYYLRISDWSSDVCSSDLERSRAGIGFVPQGRHVFPHLTVTENLEVGLSALARKGFKGPKKIPDMVYDLFPKLTQIANRKAGVLSGGDRKSTRLNSSH